MSMPVKSLAMEDIVAVVPVSGENDVFHNKRPLWLPPRARGIYGGIFIAQSLSAAQHTASHDFLPHCIHSHFIRAGKPDATLRYEVSRTSDGRSFATRHVKVLQESTMVFSAVVGLAALRSTSSTDSVAHSAPMPDGIPVPPIDPISRSDLSQAPYLNLKVGLTHGASSIPSQKKVHHWYKANEALSTSAGVHTHLNSLAYICDSYMVGLIPHVHGIWDFVSPPETEFTPGGVDLSEPSVRHSRIPSSDKVPDGEVRVGMMVTLNHSMYFHNIENIKADEWMLAELSSDWAGGGRGIVSQKIWARNGKLLATCLQEGVIRLTPTAMHSDSEGQQGAKL